MTHRRMLIALMAAAALAVSAQPASAATGWRFGPLVKTWINDCYTFDVVNGVGEYSGALYDSASPPKTGDVFYVNVVVTGIDASCVEITFPEIKLPAGVATAISPANPILCYTVDTATSTETPDTADCPASLGAPLYGGDGSIRNVNGPAPGTWDTRAPKAWEFKIPLTASTAGPKEISFPTQVISGSITQMLYPSVSLPIAQGATPPPPPPPPPAPHHAITLSSSAKSAKLSRTGALSFSVTPDGAGSATATGTIAIRKGKAIKLAKRTLTLAAGKPAKITLKLSKKNAAAVRRALRSKKLSAKITLATVSATGDKATATLTLKLKR